MGVAIAGPCVGSDRMPLAIVAVGIGVAVASLVAVGGGAVLVGTLVGRGASGVQAAKIMSIRMTNDKDFFFTALASAVI